eukprot:g1802.t1
MKNRKEKKTTTTKEKKRVMYFSNKKLLVPKRRALRRPDDPHDLLRDLIFDVVVSDIQEKKRHVFEDLRVNSNGFLLNRDASQPSSAFVPTLDVDFLRTSYPISLYGKGIRIVVRVTRPRYTVLLDHYVTYASVTEKAPESASDRDATVVIAPMRSPVHVSRTTGSTSPLNAFRSPPGSPMNARERLDRARRRLSGRLRSFRKAHEEEEEEGKARVHN